MKKLSGLMACLIAASAIAAGALDFAGVRARLGGILLGTPVVREGKAAIPVSFDYKKATQIDSALRVTGVLAEWEKDGSLEIQVSLGLIKEGAKVLNEVVVAAPAPGVHPVVYRDPDGTLHPLGNLTF